MELHEVRYFLALSRTLNFTRAAEICNVTQPALTRAIQKMEDELGGLLFSRERSNTHLTELGRLLQPQFEAMIENAESARQMATRFLRLEGAQMTLGVMCTIGPLRFVSFLSRFRAMHPGIDLTLTEGIPNRLSELMLAGELDAAIMAHAEGFPPPLSAQPIYAERFVIACSLAHPFAQRNMVEMADIDGETYLQRINCEFRDHLAEKLTECGAAIARSYRSEREDWVQTMVAAGMGICFLPEFTASVPGLVTRPVQPEVVREVCLVTVAGRRWSAPVTAFVKAVRPYPWSHEPAVAAVSPLVASA
jgi:LysR family transcriptional regulator, hydrogen peroxide-inducible genes activator